MLSEISLPGGLELRPERERDQAFLKQLFRSTRQFLYQIQLPVSHIDLLVDQQFQLQLMHYRRRFVNLTTWIIQLKSAPVGKIMIDAQEAALHVVDFCFLPDQCGKGYGSAVLDALQALAAKRRTILQLTVDRQNLAAKKFYVSLGFQIAGMSDTDETLVWSAPVSCIEQS